jgi:predicted nucleic acid-binding protein
MVRRAATGDVRLAHSDEGLRELTRVVSEKDEEGLIRSASRVFGVALDLWAHRTLYHPTRRDWPSIPDPDDGWMLDLAFDDAADYIASWDPHVTYATMPFPIEVNTPSELLFDLDHGSTVDLP